MILLMMTPSQGEPVGCSGDRRSIETSSREEVEWVCGQKGNGKLFPSEPVDLATGQSTQVSHVDRAIVWHRSFSFSLLDHVLVTTAQNRMDWIV